MSKLSEDQRILGGGWKKKKMIRQSGVFLLFLIVSLGFAPVQTVGVTVHPLVHENFYEWYKTNTEVAIDPVYAGAYVMLALDDKLYMGLSASVPTHDHSGPLFAVHDGSELRVIAQLNEQDVNRMRAVGDAIFIPGYDPNDGWDAGNLYRYDTQTEAFAKLRYRYSEPHFVDATTTDSSGKYGFSGLKATSYILKFVLPTGYEFSIQQVPYDFSRDSNPSPVSGQDPTCATGYNMPFLGVEPYIDMTIDAGMVPTSAASAHDDPALSAVADLQPDLSFYSGNMSIGDLVWVDLNKNGLQDAGEAGFAGARVELYTHDPYFPCVIHASGFWGDMGTGTLYYNGGVLPTNITFVSDDFGETWSILSQESHYYWARDFVLFKGYFYKTHREINFVANQYKYSVETVVLFSNDAMRWTPLGVPGPAEITYTASDGNTWLVRGMTIDDTNSLLEFQEKLVILDAYGTALYAITEAGEYESFPIFGADLSGILPAFHEPDFPPQLPNEITGASNRHNTLANANDELLYAIGGDNVLYATPDLRRWYPVADFNAIDAGAPLISLTFWGERQWLVAATAGETGSLYYLPHGDVIARIQP